MESSGVVRVLFSTTSGRLLDEPKFAEGAQLLAGKLRLSLMWPNALQSWKSWQPREG
jgi:hypothetical protein